MRFNEKFGYILLSRSVFDKEELIIEMIYVEPSMRRLGKGEILLKKGYKQISLYAHADGGMSTDRLVQWYRDAGFESDGDCNELLTLRL